MTNVLSDFFLTYLLAVNAQENHVIEDNFLSGTYKWEIQMHPVRFTSILKWKSAEKALIALQGCFDAWLSKFFSAIPFFLFWNVSPMHCDITEL